jgi:hypothetical protein
METLSANELDQLTVALPGALTDTRAELTRLIDEAARERGREVLRREFRQGTDPLGQPMSELYALVKR